MLKKILFLIFIYNCSSDLKAVEILNYRFGSDKENHRIVIDVDKNITFNQNIKDKTLVIKLRDKISKFAEFKKNKNTLIDEIFVDKQKNQIIISFANSFELKNKFFIKAKEKKNPRIVIDFITTQSPVFSKKIIVIDAGHGGKDSGAIGLRGILEKDITLKIAKKLKKKLKKNKTFKVILTRNNDNYLKLRNRVNIARKNKADLFVSLHADYHINRGVSGISVYTLSEKASDKEAEALARRENKEGLIEGLDLSTESKEVTNILIDLAQRETMNQSSYFVNFLIDELKNKTNLLQRTHRFAGFAVLKAPDVPSVLLEMGYLSNNKDSKLLLDSQYHDKIIDGIIEAMKKYFSWKQKNQIN